MFLQVVLAEGLHSSEEGVRIRYEGAGEECVSKGNGAKPGTPSSHARIVGSVLQNRCSTFLQCSSQ